MFSLSRSSLILINNKNKSEEVSTEKTAAATVATAVASSVALLSGFCDLNSEGKTYMLRMSNVGSALSLNFIIKNHKTVLVETEGSYTSQITLDSLDVHVGLSYSVLVTADQDDACYYMVATPTLANIYAVMLYGGGTTTL
ncbi:hypothetical protein IFM89_022373 [Coptis chinensis]|uniref:Plastocyanin-like domain-containing protein n=1 Tax=Coptis chinensis TaxID=261450 RepID=A0A835H227_9MAGN|nr:hypothetical protein IFM89_022373 [Coptis chinensis]